MMLKFTFILLLGISAFSCDVGQRRAPSSSSVESKQGKGSDEFDKEPLQMVEFYSPYCASCKETARKITQFVHSCHLEGIVLRTVDISNDDNARLSEQYDVRAVPTVVFLDEAGNEIERLEGGQSSGDFEHAVDSLGRGRCRAGGGG